jgi:sodium-dependent dicarboxylate transporter 2/3/5
MFELLPLPVTALIPVAVFPLLGILSTNAVSMCYMKDTCMLYLGGDLVFQSIQFELIEKKKYTLLIVVNCRLILEM